eukprot:sb/3461941/
MRNVQTYEERQPALWDPGNWGKSRIPDTLPSKVSKTARGGGVIKLPGKVEGRGESHKPIGVVKKDKDGPGDFVYSDSGSDSDGVFSEEYTNSAAVTSQLSTSLVLNVPGIEKKVEKCSVEATQSTVTSTFCKESCSKFLSEGVRKRNSLFVLYGSFDEHYTEIIHLRQELASVVSCAMMFDLESCNEQQAEALLWKDVFYQLIQHYRSAAGKASMDSVKAKLTQQLEEHLGEAVSFYNMLVRQIQKRYNVNYKHPTAGHSRSQVLALLLLHKIFLWVGDLFRYLAQAREVDEWGQARTYYLMAQTLAPRNPRPYHQLALLGKYAHRRLHAVYYFCLSLLVRNPFPQSREMLMNTLVELRRKSVLLAKHDKARNKRAASDISEVVNPRKTIEWQFGSDSADPSVKIPKNDLKKRFVVYLVSALGGLLTSIDVDRVESEVQSFRKFYNHYINKSNFAADELYQQLFIVFLYSISSSPHSAKCASLLEEFLLPTVTWRPTGNSAGDQRRDSESCGDEWLCELHSQFSLVMLLTQAQIEVEIRTFLIHGKEKLTHYLSVIIVSSFESLSRTLPFISYTSETGFTTVAKQDIAEPDPTNSAGDATKQISATVDNLSTASDMPVSPVSPVDNPQDIVDNTQDIVDNPKDIVDNPQDIVDNPQDIVDNPHDIVDNPQDNVDSPDAVDSGEESPDVEIMERLTIKEEGNKEEEREEDGNEDDEMKGLRKQRDKLRETLEQRQEKQDKISAAVKEIQGKRILITVKPRIIVPDTNCFLDKLNKIKKLAECDRLKVAVPLMVLEEIRGLCKSESKAEEAGIALDVVEQMISSKSISLLTSMGNLMDTADFKEARATRGCNDDIILSGVHRLSNSTGTVTWCPPPLYVS